MKPILWLTNSWRISEIPSRKPRDEEDEGNYILEQRELHLRYFPHMDILLRVRTLAPLASSICLPHPLLSLSLLLLYPNAPHSHQLHPTVHFNRLSMRGSDSRKAAQRGNKKRKGDDDDSKQTSHRAAFFFRLSIRFSAVSSALRLVCLSLRFHH